MRRDKKQDDEAIFEVFVKHLKEIDKEKQKPAVSEKEKENTSEEKDVS